MTLRSMARIASACLAWCTWAETAVADEVPPSPTAAPYAAGYAATPHAPPPRLALSPAPAPELPGLAYERRPFELTPELLLGFASCADGTVSDARCTGLAAGPGLGVSALWRLSPYFAFGAAVAALGFGFRPAPATGLHQASARGSFYGLVGRVYAFDHGMVEPYLELGIGGGSLATSAREADGIRYDEIAGGGALRVGGAVEFFFSRHVRVGPAFDWTRFELLHLRRCTSSACTELDRGGYGHGTGFTSVSLRLTVALGAGL